MLFFDPSISTYRFVCLLLKLFARSVEQLNSIATEIYTNSAGMQDVGTKNSSRSSGAFAPLDVISFFRVRHVDRAMHELVWPVFYLQSD